MKYIKDGANFISITSVEIDSDKDFKQHKLTGVNIPTLEALIQQIHPTLQVLSEMDETTYSNVEKSGSNYQLPSSSTPEDLTTWTETDGQGLITVTSAKADVVGETSNGPLSLIYKAASLPGDFTLDFETYYTYSNATWGHGIGVSANISAKWKASPVTCIVVNSGPGNILHADKSIDGTITHSTANITFVLGTLYYCRLARSGSTVSLSVFSDSARTTHITGSPQSFTETSIAAYAYIAAVWNSGYDTAVETMYHQNIKYSPPLTGNLFSNAASADSAVLSFYKYLKSKVSNGGSTHATPIQAEIYGNADSYAAPLNATKITIDPADPRIILKRDALDTITASAGSQTVWNMTVAGGMAAKPNHGTILATEIGVSSILAIELTKAGDYSDTVVLIENVDYVVDYSTRTATKITLASGTGILNAQSKIRLSWIADVLKVSGTHNTALKVKLYLNRTATSETSPDIEPIGLGTLQYTELEYGT